jgi:hypothetical protein
VGQLDQRAAPVTRGASSVGKGIAERPRPAAPVLSLPMFNGKSVRRRRPQAVSCFSSRTSLTKGDGHRSFRDSKCSADSCGECRKDASGLSDGHSGQMRISGTSFMINMTSVARLLETSDATAYGAMKQVRQLSKAVVPAGDFTLTKDVATAPAFFPSHFARDVTRSMLIVGSDVPLRHPSLDVKNIRATRS